MLKCPGRWSGELERCKTLRYFSLAPSVWYPTKLQSDQAEGTGCWLLKTGDNWLWQLDSFFASGFVDRCDDGANCDFHIAFHSADMWRGAPVSRKMRKRTFQLLFVILLGMCSPLQGAVPPSLPQEKNHERNSHDQSTTKGHILYFQGWNNGETLSTDCWRTFWKITAKMLVRWWTRATQSKCSSILHTVNLLIW